MTPRRIIWMLISALLLMLLMPVSAQDTGDLVQVTVEAGYDQYFRPDYWLPIRINVRNNGDSITGRLTIRPETSGRVVSNAYSTPIDLPSGSEKTAFLYIQARTFPTQIIVELLDDDGVRVAEQTHNLRVLEPEDVLYLVVSRLSAESLNLNNIAPAGSLAEQARWETSHLPPAVNALQAINTLIFYDVNSEDLTVSQREAVTQWVAMGGHLIVIGGARWQETSAAFTTILPIVPSDGQSVDDVQGLATFANDNAELAERSFIAVGELQEDAQVLAETSEGIPVLARRRYGSGTVDFLAGDPTLAPLLGWDRLGDFWFNLLMTTAPEPGWTRGFIESQDAARASAILPDIELLPPVMSMIAYILAYILLIGPLNYFVLSRLNKREWAWFSIPLLIAAFTGVAWNVGFNLRGSEIIVSRLNVVQSFVDTDIARFDQLISVLSPRRETYVMTVPDGRFVRVMPGLSQNNFLQQNITQSTANIVQNDDFLVENVSIDGGIFANFTTSGVTQAPDINGSVTIVYETDLTPEDSPLDTQTIRGSVRNNSDITLEDAVIISRNGFYRLDEPFAPGNVVNFDSSDMQNIRDNDNDLVPSESPMQIAYGLDLGVQARSSSNIFNSLETTRVVMGDTLTPSRSFNRDNVDDSEETLRRRALLRSFMRDQFATNSIGNSAYLIGWSTDEVPPDIELQGVTYLSVDTVLHIIQLSVDVEIPTSSELVTIEGDQYIWAMRDRDLVEGSFNDLTLINPATLVTRLMPLAEARLNRIETMTIILDRSSSYGRDVSVELWDWTANEWVEMAGTVRETYEVPNPQRFVGANGMIDMRMSLNRDVPGSAATARIRDTKIVVTGYF
ncbi:MAG: hypothetical protein Q9P01_18185 [Anaerolineae bacterium]|nr:hypothetical protein [Anaerolineae bacterium]MDQ7036685.1 hypothetical protein [Anaerolineae bacterium]